MKRMVKFLVLVICLLFIPICADAKEEWESIEKQKLTLKLEQVEEFESSINAKVEELNTKETNNWYYRYKMNVVKHSVLEEDKNEKVSTWVKVKETFNSIFAANEYYNSILVSEPLYKGESKIEEYEKERIEKGDKNILICLTSDCKEELQRIEQQLETNQKINKNIEIIKEQVFGAEKNVIYGSESDDSEGVLFDTKEEANAFSQSYQPTLAGYKFIKNSVVPSKIFYNEEDTITERFDTVEEAQTALNDFKLNHSSVESSITKVRNQEKDTVNSYTENFKYDSYESAKSRADSLTVDNENYKITGTVRKVTESSDDIKIEDIVKESFDTKEEAEEALEELKKNYIIDSYEIKSSSYEELTWGENSEVSGEIGGTGNNFTYHHFDVKIVTKYTYVNSDGTSETVYGTLTVDSPIKLKNGNDETKVYMSSEPKNDETGKYKEYNSLDRKNLTVTNNSAVEITGTVTFKHNGVTKTLPYTVSGILSESQNECGGVGSLKGYDLIFKSVKIINNKVVIDANIITKYSLTGKMHTETDKYVVDVKEVTKGYDYSLQATGLIRKETEKYKVNSEFVKIDTKDTYKLNYDIDTYYYDKYYTLSYETYKYNTYQYVDVEYEIERTKSGIGNVDIIEPPHTGVSKNNHLFNFIVFLVFAILVKFSLKKINN